VNTIRVYTIRTLPLLLTVFVSLGLPSELTPKTEQEPITHSTRNDTLSLVLGSESLYYPFGKYPDALTLEKSLGKRATMLRPASKRKMKSSDNHILVIGTDSIKVFVGDRVGGFLAEIVEAKIRQPGIKFKNGLEIGDSKSEVFEIYFSPINNVAVQKFKVLELVSGLDGIWHYYTFHGDVLVNIEIKSDYVWKE
jgi:hypothetical protein